jgi:hypothetical protein
MVWNLNNKYTKYMKYYIIIVLLIILYIVNRIRENYKDYECINWNKEYVFRTLLEYWTQFAEKHNIKYSIAFGTLLGYEREKEFIGFDGDVDVMIDNNAVDKLIELAKDPKENRVIFTKDLKSELEKSAWKPNEVKIIVIYEDYYIDCNGNKTNGEYIDNCSLGIPKYGGGELYARVVINNINNSKYHLDLFNKKKKLKYLKEDTEDCILENIKTKCFKDKIAFLKEQYGDKWNIPLKICDKENNVWIKNEDYYKDK